MTTKAITLLESRRDELVGYIDGLTSRHEDARKELADINRAISLLGNQSAVKVDDIQVKVAKGKPGPKPKELTATLLSEVAKQEQYRAKKREYMRQKRAKENV